MDAIALHLEVRNGLSLADELSRYEHALGNDSLAGHLAASRTALSELERRLGKTHELNVSPNPLLIERIAHALDVIRDRLEEIPLQLRPRFVQLMEALERITFAETRPNEAVPAKPVLGLPIARVIPQNVHSVMDYVAAGAYVLSAKLAVTARGRAVGAILGSSVAGVSLLSDYELSAIKLIPIEAHEVLDHASGSAAIAAPFALGYVRKDPVAAIIQIVTGACVIASSLFTDYRASKGVGRALRSKGGPRARERARRSRERVPEVQRPLEGLATASALPRLDL